MMAPEPNNSEGCPSTPIPSGSQELSMSITIRLKNAGHLKTREYHAVLFADEAHIAASVDRQYWRCKEC